MTARVVPSVPGGAAPLVSREVAGVDVRDLHTDPRVRHGRISVRWDGLWHVREAGRYRLVADTDGTATVEVDGTAALVASGARSRAWVDLAAGPRSLAVTYESAAAPRRLWIEWSGPSGARGALDAPWTFVAPPEDPTRAPRARMLRRLAAMAWLLPPAVALALAVARGRLGPRAKAAVRVALASAVVLAAGALRFEALVARYLWQGPAWAVDAERALSGLRPRALRWTPSPEEEFAGDPLTYLRRARAMRGLYEADVREPAFPYAARLLLPLAGEGTWPVNAASAAFSTLLVLSTYVLGATAFSPGVGLGAALVLALDRDAIWWGVEGFRDDAFAAMTVLAAAALVRLRVRPSPARAVLAGLAGGAACLTRVSALSFLLPAHAWCALGRGPGARARRRAVAASVLVALALAAPYLIACAIEYGDPLHAVNFHTKFYRARSGMEHETAMSWAGYLRSGFGAGELARRGLAGLTVYPFSNKWSGLDWVSPWLRRVLVPAALAGLVLFARSAVGRVLLVVLVSSLLPYAFTWAVPGGAEWRFTLVAYPFYLVAAVLALERAAALIKARLRPPARDERRFVASYDP